MSHWMEIKEATEKFGLPLEQLRQWVKEGRISSIGEEETDEFCLIEESSLEDYLQNKKNPVAYDEKELNENLLTLNDLLKQTQRELDRLNFFKTLDLSEESILRPIIDELALLILPGRRRNIFLEMCSGEDMEQVARRHHLRVDELRKVCLEIQHELQTEAGYLQDSRNMVIQQEQTIRELEHRCKFYRSELHILRVQQGIYEDPDNYVEDLPEEVATLLFRSLYEEEMDKKYAVILNRVDVYTMGDLFRRMYEFKGQGLNYLPGLSPKGVNYIIDFLKSKNYINEKGKCIYFRYL